MTKVFSPTYCDLSFPRRRESYISPQLRGRQLHVFSPAKINLTLDILGKSSNGYHYIESILTEISDIHDEITILKSDKTEIVFSPKLSCKIEESSIFKAVKSILPGGKFVKIMIKKNIPEKSGLGGAASNAAAVLKALNKIFKLEYSNEKLAKIGAKIGMDVPFFIFGGTAFCTHFGEKVKPLRDAYKVLESKGYKIKIIKTGVKIDTLWAYKNIDLKKCGRNIQKTKFLLKALQNNDAAAIIDNLHNDFETLVYPKYPELQQKTRSLCGSGGAVYIIS